MSEIISVGALVQKTSGSLHVDQVGVVCQIDTNDLGVTVLTVLLNDSGETPDIAKWLRDYVEILEAEDEDR